VFQGRSDGIFCAYRAPTAKNFWEFDAGTESWPASYLRSRRSSISDADGRMGRRCWNYQSTGSRANQNRALPVLTFAIVAPAKLMFHVSDIKDLFQGPHCTDSA